MGWGRSHCITSCLRLNAPEEPYSLWHEGEDALHCFFQSLALEVLFGSTQHSSCRADVSNPGENLGSPKSAHYRQVHQPAWLQDCLPSHQLTWQSPDQPLSSQALLSLEAAGSNSLSLFSDGVWTPSAHCKQWLHPPLYFCLFQCVLLFCEDHPCCSTACTHPCSSDPASLHAACLCLWICSLS